MKPRIKRANAFQGDPFWSCGCHVPFSDRIGLTPLEAFVNWKRDIQSNPLYKLYFKDVK